MSLSQQSPFTTLPPWSGGFFARTQLEQALQQSMLQHQLISVVGPPGCGKSVLTRYIADSKVIREHFQHIWWANHLQLSAIEPLIAHAKNHGVDTDKHLFVLDHVQTTPEFVSSWLATLNQRDNISIICTRHQAFRLRAEHTIVVGGLSCVPQSTETHSEATQFFLERASHHGARHTTDAAFIESADQLCQQLGGNPLALELAASKTKVIRPSSLLKLIQEDVGVLEQHLYDLSSRHHRLPEINEDLWTSLNAQEKSLVSQCLTFQGLFQLEDAAFVLEQELTHLLLQFEHLIEKCVLETVEAPKTQQVLFRVYPPLALYLKQTPPLQQNTDRVRKRFAERMQTLAKSAIDHDDFLPWQSANIILTAQTQHPHAKQWCLCAMLWQESQPNTLQTLWKYALAHLTAFHDQPAPCLPLLWAILHLQRDVMAPDVALALEDILPKTIDPKRWIESYAAEHHITSSPLFTARLKWLDARQYTHPGKETEVSNPWQQHQQGYVCTVQWALLQTKWFLQARQWSKAQRTIQLALGHLSIFGPCLALEDAHFYLSQLALLQNQYTNAAPWLKRYLHQGNRWHFWFILSEIGRHPALFGQPPNAMFGMCLAHGLNVFSDTWWDAWQIDNKNDIPPQHIEALANVCATYKHPQPIPPVSQDHFVQLCALYQTIIAKHYHQHIPEDGWLQKARDHWHGLQHLDHATSPAQWIIYDTITKLTTQQHDHTLAMVFEQHHVATTIDFVHMRFRIGDRDWVNIQNKPKIRRLIEKLIESCDQETRTPISAAALIEYIWHDEHPSYDSAQARLYNLIATLRRLGWKDLLVYEDDGYIIATQYKLYIIREPSPPTTTT